MPFWHNYEPSILQGRGKALKFEAGSFDKTFDYAHVLDKEYDVIKRRLQ